MDTNISSSPSYRSLPILVVYLTCCAGLAAQICRSIYRRYQKTTTATHKSPGQNSTHAVPLFPVFVFVSLTALSIGSTWYYMFSFFVHSYNTWEGRQPDVRRAVIAESATLTRWEWWLHDTKLFREAWETVSESPARSWWSGQIFLWTVWWSVFLGVMGRRYNISHVWRYMLLGQIVAISFAQNLFILNVLVSGSPSFSSSSSTKQWTPPSLLELGPIAISLLSAAVVPFVAHTAYFMPVLLVPHLLLFIPGLLSPSTLPEGWGAQRSLTRYYTRVFWFVLASAVAIQAMATSSLFQENGETLQGVGSLLGRLIEAMYEHPAVGSVSSDVVCCSITVVVWMVLRGSIL